MSIDTERPDDLEDDDLDDAAVGYPASTVEYIRAEHVAQMRMANAGRGVDEMARLVRLGTMLPDSLEAARTEMEAARRALGLVHETAVGEVPSAEVYAAMSADPATMPYLRQPVRTGCGMSYPLPLPDVEARPVSPPVAVAGCDDCSVEPGETHLWAGCPGAIRSAARGDSGAPSHPDDPAVPDLASALLDSLRSVGRRR